ncbi:MAG: 3-phosphoglycerate dehydrogenase family protein, partial [Pseudomonadota bacterium]
MAYKIKLFNHLATGHLAADFLDKFSLSHEIEHADAIVLRSHDLHQEKIDDQVKVVARAGVGVNNVPIDKLSKTGIVVMNTPGANANAVKELVISGMLLASRNICVSWDYVKQLQEAGKQLTAKVEQGKKTYVGVEIADKTLGIIGLGNIGVRVANAAIALGMQVIGYDPHITVRNSWQLSAQVKQAHYLDEIFAVADYISLHVPFTEKTQNLIGLVQLEKIKSTAVLLNFARQEIVNQNALIAAIKAKKLSAYVCDFPHEDFRDIPEVITLPHLGASMLEAQEKCAQMAFAQVAEFLLHGNIVNSVNFPDTSLPHLNGYRITIVNRNVPNMVSQITAKL